MSGEKKAPSEKRYFKEAFFCYPSELHMGFIYYDDVAHTLMVGARDVCLAMVYILQPAYADVPIRIQTNDSICPPEALRVNDFFFLVKREKDYC